MFYRLVIFVLLVLADLPVDAATLKGLILVNELSGPPMENVGVDAIGTNRTISDLSGKFTLEFPQRRGGDTVRIIVEKEGYVVVNDVQLQLALPADADAAPLSVILAKEGDREEMARRFYRLKSFDVIEGTYKKKVKELEDAHQADSSSLEQLRQQRDQANAAAEKAAEELAKNQPGQGSELYQNAMRLFLAGKVDEAIQFLDDEKLRSSIAQAEKKIADAVQGWLFKARLFNLQFRFEEALKAYESALAHIKREKDPQLWAETEVAVGITHAELGIRVEGKAGKEHLAAAISAYRSALEINTREQLPQQWAMTQNNLGAALQEQGTRTGGEQGTELLAQAVAACRSALEIRTREQLPQDWAMTQNNLGAALQEQGTRTGGEQGTELLAQAVAAYRSALEIRTREQLPQDWAMTQNNLGNALNEQGTRTGGEQGTELLAQAVAAYRSALEIRTREQLPQDWAMTQNNLGNALNEQGTRTGGEQGTELLAQAVAAYRSALEIRTREQLPQQWATTQNNLGAALQEQGTRTGGEQGTELLAQAVVAYRSALEIHTREQLPQQWATTQNNLGAALEALGNQLEGEEGLKRKREAVELLRDVVSYQPDDQSRYRLASALGGLAFTLVLNSQFAEAQTHCEEAQRLANEIGDGIQKSDRDNLIFIQGNLAHALFFQGHYDEALAIYRKYWDKPLHGKTFGEITLEDFAAFDKAGLTDPDLSRMKQALSDLTSKSPSPR